MSSVPSRCSVADFSTLSSRCSVADFNTSLPQSPFSRTSSLCCFCSDIQPHNFANVEDMLFEVFRCEETDTIDSIAIGQFLRVSSIQTIDRIAIGPFLRVSFTQRCSAKFVSKGLFINYVTPFRPKIDPFPPPL